MKIEDMRLGMEVRGPQGHAIIRKITAAESTPITVEYSGGYPQWGDPEQYEPVGASKSEGVWKITPERVAALKHCQEIIGMFGVSLVLKTDVELGLMIFEAENAAKELTRE